MDDRRQLQLVQPVLRRLERVALESRLLGSAHDPAQARAVLTGAGDVPEERQRDLAAERAADHRERRHAAVGEVDLAHEREATSAQPTARAQATSPETSTPAAIRSSGDGGGVGGRWLTPEAASPPPKSSGRTAMRLRCSRARSPSLEANVGSSVAELVEHRRVELEQPALARRRHRRQARADPSSAPTSPNTSPARRKRTSRRADPCPRVLDQPAGLDDPPGWPCWLTFPHDDVAVVGLDPATPADDQLDALRVEVPERLVRAQERGDPLGVRLLC